MPEILRFRGDHRRYDPEHVLGPDRDGRRMRIVSTLYSRETDMSVATLRAVMPEEYRRDVLPRKVEQGQAQIRIWKLFNG